MNLRFNYVRGEHKSLNCQSLHFQGAEIEASVRLLSIFAVFGVLSVVQLLNGSAGAGLPGRVTSDHHLFRPSYKSVTHLDALHLHYLQLSEILVTASLIGHFHHTHIHSFFTSHSTLKQINLLPKLGVLRTTSVTVSTCRIPQPQHPPATFI